MALTMENAPEQVVDVQNWRVLCESSQPHRNMFLSGERQKTNRKILVEIQELILVNKVFL